MVLAFLAAAAMVVNGAIDPSGDTSGANDAAAIQLAIDSAANGGTVTLGAGMFYINEQLYVTNGVTLAGQGWEDTVIKAASGKNIRCVTLKEGAKLVGVTVTGGKTTSNWQHGSGVLVEDGTVSWCCVSNNTSIGRNIYGVGVSFKKGSIDHSIVAFNILSVEHHPLSRQIHHSQSHNQGCQVPVLLLGGQGREMDDPWRW